MYVGLSILLVSTFGILDATTSWYPLLLPVSQQQSLPAESSGAQIYSTVPPATSLVQNTSDQRMTVVHKNDDLVEIFQNPVQNIPKEKPSVIDIDEDFLGVLSAELADF